MRRCEDEKMRYRPPLLEEPCAQALSGKMNDMEDALFRYAMAACRRLGGSAKSQDKGVASINLAQAVLKMRLNNMDDALFEYPTDLWNLFA